MHLFLYLGGNGLFQIDYKSSVPIYDQIVKSAIKLISLGALRTGDKMPSVRQTAVTLGVNPNTVQKAYNILESKGVVVSVSGKGSFVSEEFDAKEELKSEAVSSLFKAMEDAKCAGVSRAEILQAVEKLYGGVKQND